MVGSRGVLLIDWENLAGSVADAGFRTAGVVDALVAEAKRLTGDQMTRAHAAAHKVDRHIADEFTLRGIKHEIVGTAKQQADIMLCVMAMDYLYGDYAHFVLVTGDQDFLPLMQRLYQEQRQVHLIYGNGERLSAELRAFLENTPGVTHSNLSDFCKLQKATVKLPDRAKVALLEMQRRGFALSGPRAPEQVGAQLYGWGIIEDASEESYWSLIDQVCERVLRRDVLGQKTASGWLPANKKRTVLRLDAATQAYLVKVDYAVSTIQHPKFANGVRASDIASGPLEGKEVMASEILSTLEAIGLVRRGARGLFAMTMTPGTPDLRDGYLEPLWRVAVGFQAESYKQSTDAIRGVPLRILQNGGVGRDALLKRSKGKLEATIKYAKGVNVVDDRVAAGAWCSAVTDSPLGLQGIAAVDRVVRRLAADPDLRLQEDVLAMMASVGGDVEPAIGFDRDGRRKLIRIMTQSGLLRQTGNEIELLASAWLDNVKSSL